MNTLIEVLNKVNELLSVIDGSTINKFQKLKLLRLSLELKLKLLNSLKSLNSLNKDETSRPGRKRNGNSDYKRNLILQFIRQKGGRVSADDLRNLGIAGRTLRRYLRRLKESGEITLEKRGREHFYFLTDIS